ncbi:MAG: prepilin-type N-terminal cleavage/methylation domain-containing protein [Comamonadaceae bacterium]|jgi:type IV fimbrial biogenesis protein FimT|uniref:Type II secretion system protein H n=1 Tax=Hydrogenophaga borbori TaxID=2294117 RepID=A0A372EFI8_9BURK|nr:GspH/FimT family pseudopilin [Hydrogenophaga borbori]NCT98828.1 prepilin-type N-terminal cleavage/methylation domain-containing protein [Comamonadaceae bacterium]RFP77147.1 prepilin-type N-terminal cleavage/methylation domain-containing protein [Hydrogenophaga borbori]
MSAKRRHRGFTLIELLMVVVIFGIGASLAAPSFGTLLGNYRVRAGSESILNGLYLARAEAIRRNSPVSFTLGAAGSGWTIAQVAPATTIQTRADGESPGVATASSTASRTLTFLANGMVDTTPATRLEQVTVSSAVANTETRRINIFGGGLIRMCDPAVATANDPRRC